MMHLFVSEHYEFAFGFCWGSVLEAEDGACVEGVGESHEGACVGCVCA
jgi:hypothetical protein